LKILKACNLNDQGIEQLNAYAVLFMTKLLAQSNARVLGVGLTNPRGIARTTKLATHPIKVQTTTKCTMLGEGHGIECLLEMQPSIKRTRHL
jgi:hydroxymethylpyrimidine/phosphomethylpyrimidine kinase